MAYLSEYQYYENGGAAPTDKNWGSYQYVSLEENSEYLYAYAYRESQFGQ